MLISLDKNKWMYEWIMDQYSEEFYNIVVGYDIEVPHPKKIRKDLATLLTNKGYKVKLTTKFDIIISMSEQEYILLKLKYE